MTTVIVITAKRNGFRRCGVAHSDQPTTWQQDDFTDEQWDELCKEPQLVLAVEERDLALGLEHRHAFTSPASPQEAPNTLQSTQSQALEANATALGNAGPNLQDGASLGPNLPPLAGGEIDLGIEALWDEAFKEDTDRHAAKLVAELWDEALAEEAQREAAKVKVEPKPKKATAKAGSLDK